MNNDWKHIREQIRKAETPLSDDAWNNMESMLDRRRTAWWLIPAGIAATALIGWGIVVLMPYHVADQPGNEGMNAPVQHNMPMGTDDADDLSVPVPDHSSDGRVFEDREADSGSSAGVNKQVSTDPASIKQSGSALAEHRTVEQHDSKRESLIALNARSYKISQPTLSEDYRYAPVSEFENADSVPVRTESKRESRLELRVYAGPAITAAPDMRPVREQATHKDYATVNEAGALPGLGFDAGVELRYRIWGPLRVSTGFGLRRMVTRNDYDYTVNEVPVIDSASDNIIGYISVDPQHKQFSGYNNYTYLSVPVSLYYRLPLGERWSVTAEAIHHFSFLIDQESYSLNTQSLEMEETGNDMFNPNQNAFQFRLGLQYELNTRLSLALEPAYRSYYRDIYNNGTAAWRPRDLSMSLSAILRLE